MSVTLQTLINQAADYIKVDLEEDDDTDKIKNIIISALNEAKNTIAKKVYPLYHTENVEIDIYSSFPITLTEKTFYRLVGVKYNDTVIDTEQYGSTIYCNAPANATISVTYQYIPEDMEEYSDVYPFPDVVDYRILCYKAAQTYFEIKGTSSSIEKASIWERKYKDGIKGILSTSNVGTIKNVYKFNSLAW